MTWHKFWYGHKKEVAIIGYDGICNVWGCKRCEFNPHRAEREMLKKRSNDEW